MFAKEDMKDTEQLLYRYIRNSSQAKTILSRLKGLDVEDIDIQTALVEVLSLTEPMDLLDQDLSVEKMVEVLRDFDFQKYHPELLGQIELEESVIPQGTPRLLTEITVRSKGEVWRIHKNDPDPFPSNPHAENYDAGLKLDLSNGRLYRRRGFAGQISKKNLQRIRDKAGSITLPQLSI